MTTTTHTVVSAFLTVAFSSMALTATEASASVKFRLGYEADTNQYAVYMTPDSVPSPDMLLSAQVTLVVPHGENAQRFTINGIESSVSGIHWLGHSRVDAPTENPEVDYISMGYFFTNTTPPQFGWVTGKEMKVLSFFSNKGCVEGIKLMDNHDPFNTLPNSAGTNPGNDFLNVGWLMSNAYVGNYGEAVSCAQPVAACNYNQQDKRILQMIDVLEQYKQGANDSFLRLINYRISVLESRLSCHP